jgi:hypothetical protein
MRIQKYSFGSISVDGQTYKDDLIIYPDRIQEDWRRKIGHRLQVEDLAEILSDPPEALIVGQGDYGRMELDTHVYEVLKKLRVELVAAPTKEACERFNELSGLGKKVVAALHLTC